MFDWFNSRRVSEKNSMVNSHKEYYCNYESFESLNKDIDTIFINNYNNYININNIENEKELCIELLEVVLSDISRRLSFQIFNDLPILYKYQKLKLQILKDRLIHDIKLCKESEKCFFKFHQIYESQVVINPNSEENIDFLFFFSDFNFHFIKRTTQSFPTINQSYSIQNIHYSDFKYLSLEYIENKVKLMEPNILRLSYRGKVLHESEYSDSSIIKHVDFFNNYCSSFNLEYRLHE